MRAVTKKLMLLAAIISCIGSLAACQSANYAGTADERKIEPSPGVSPEPTAELIPTAGGELRIPMPQNPSSLDPLMVNTREMRSVLSLVFESLLQYDANNRLVPWLAENWNVDETGKVWTLKLRKGVAWHGVSDQLTAADVVYTYEQLLGESMAESIYATSLGYIAEMDAPDDYSLVITATEPGNAVLHALTFPVMSERFQGMELPIGTGPYRVNSYDPANGILLSRNEHWWKQPPYIDTVVAIPHTNNTTALAALELRQIDFVPTSVLTASQYREQGVTEIADITTQLCEFLIPNLNTKIVSDLNVRKAIAYALDRRDIISRAYLNHAFASDVPISPQSWLYDAKFKVYDYSLAQAKALLAEAGWKDMDGDGILDKQIDGRVERLAIKLLVNVSPDNQTHKDVAVLIRDQLARVGIEIEIDQPPWTQGESLYVTKLQSGSFDLVLCTFNLDRHPDLRFLIGTAGEYNYSKYSSAAMNQMMDAARAEIDEREIKTRYMELQQKIIDDLPLITLFFRTNSILYNTDIEGVSSAQDMDVFRGVDKWFYKHLAAR